MGKMKNKYIELQQEMHDKMKTSADTGHWSYCAELVQQVIDAEYGELAEARKNHLKLNN